MRLREIPALTASITLFLATCLFQTIFLERGASLYDEGSVIAIGVSLSEGDLLYGDIKTFVMPLTYELMGVIYRIFGPSVLVGRIFILLCFSLVVVFVHRILLKVLTPRASLLGALALWPIKALAFPLWTIVNYSQVALLFLVGTMLALVQWLSSRRRAHLIATGLLAGMTVVSKQDFGAHVTVAVCVAIAFDWWIRSPRSMRSLSGQVGLVAATAAVPVVVMLAYYGWHGTVRSMLYRTVIGPLLVPAQYSTSFPGLEWWSPAADGFSVIVFSYFPAPFLEMAWAGSLNVFDWKQLLSIELAIKASYYLPLLAMAAGTVMAVRRQEARTVAQRSTLVLIVVAAVVAYVLIYRADWTHLMNLYVVMVLPVIAVIARWAGAGRAWRSLVAGAVLLAWMVFGGIATYQVWVRFASPVESVRGRILTVPRTATEINGVLAYLEAEPTSSRVLFMPFNALIYFLSGRPILAPNDLVMPALIADDQDDRELAEAVAKADVVIYNPTIFPTVQAALYQYAPQTATALSSLFDRERELANTAVVLRRARDRSPPMVSDLWEASGTEFLEPLRASVHWGAEGIAGLPPMFRDHWMVYRVVAVQTGEPGEERCFERRHCAEAGQWLTGMPITHPAGWGLADGKAVRFELRARSGGEVVVLASVVRKSSDGPESVRFSLDPFAGQCLDLSFCVTPLESDLPRGAAGWAEPRIVEGVAESPPGSASRG